MSLEFQIKRLARSLSVFSDIHNKQVAPVLTQHERDLEDVKEDIQALYELVEMNFHVLCRAMMEGVFDTDDRGQMVTRLNELQDEYLATISVFFFFRQLQSFDDASEEEE